MQEANFYQKLENNAVLCNLCPRYCRIKPDQYGYCFVRQNIDGKLYAIAYGRPYAVNVDPIEKKPLFHFLPGSRILSIGTAGCNMGCKYCQNCDISKAKFDQKKTIDLPPNRVVQLALHYDATGIAYTYNEPTIFAEYAMDTATLGQEQQLKNVMVTNGYITGEAINDVYQNMDAANVDLKGFTKDFYQRLTSSKLEPVLNTLISLYKKGIWIELTNLIIPSYNDEHEQVKRMSEWIINKLSPYVPVHFTAFHPDYKLKHLPPTTPTTLLEMRKLALEVGLKYVYVGNIANEDASSTYCHNCGSLLIRRSWHKTYLKDLENGNCKNCGQSIPGVFS